MLGPVYALEWKTAGHRSQKYPWRWIYVGILLIQMAVLAYEAIIRSRVDLAYILEAATYLILVQQSAAIILVTPAFAAGSITDEKRRGTLDFMLMTPLTSAEIVLGKWLGQATQILHLISPGYFLIAIFAGALMDDARPIYLCIIEQVALIYSLTAFSLLASVLNRSTTKAIIGVYLCFGTLLALEWLTDLPVAGPSDWPIFTREEIPLREHVIAAIALAAMASFTLAMAVWRLRPAHEQQQTAASRVLGRWWDRPPIADAPMRWKERFIGDWMSVPIWRMLPRWMKCTGVAVLVAGIAIVWPLPDAFIVLGIFQLLFSAVFVAVRAAGAITSEKENQTWESLLTTHMDAYQIVRGKLWGQIDALRPFLFAYLLPALIGSCFAGIESILWISYTWLASWVILYYLGAVGIANSVKATNTWRSILVTLTIGQASTLITTGVFTVMVGSLTLIAVSSLTVAGPTAFALNIVLLLASVVGLLWIFAQTEEVLQIAQRDLRRARRDGNS